VHYFFAHPGVPIKNAVGTLGPGLDLQGDGGYIIASPSLHRSGRRYTWELTAHPEDTPLAPMPDWLVALCRMTVTGHGPDAGAPIATGQRNRTLFQLGCSMRARGCASEAILAALEAINTTQCLPPLPVEEVHRITSSCLRYPAGTPTHSTADQPENSSRIRAATTPTTPYSDVSNAEALVAAHGQNLRYCYAWGRWLIWSGTHWRIDDTGEIMQRARATLKVLVAKALDAEDRPLVQHLTRSHTHGRLTAMGKQAQSMGTMPLLPAACDTDPWLLNCRNGTLDLRTGSLRPHCRADLLPRCLAVAYVPEARCPTWERFLWRVLGGTMPPAGTDTSGIPHAPATEADARATRLVRFLQRAVGYTLTGVTREDCLFLLYGRGRNGKSRFLEALHALLGPYAKTASMRTFLVQAHDTVRNDLADLYGVRYVSASEVQDGQRFSEGLVKQLTGGDRIKARFLFQEYFEFVPQFKLFLACNHKPIVRGTDLAIWERIKLVPFTVTIPPDERDTDLGTKLRAELEGILAWAVRGCLAWQQEGLGTPPEVAQATRAYQAEMDVLGHFFEDCCRVSADVRVQTGHLYHAYTRWCDRNGETALTPQGFGRQLTTRELTQHKGTGGTRYWLGLGLLECAGDAARSGKWRSGT
jgi:putative DNA primase/helicase